MELTTMRRRVASARVAQLATTTRQGRPHIVPVCFALVGEQIVTVVDGKPKTTTALRRLENVRANPDVSALFHHFEEDWDQLWWVRIDGRARVVDSSNEVKHLIPHLLEKYPQYRIRQHLSPAIVIAIDRWVGWTATR